MSYKSYVVGFLLSEDTDQILFVRKLKPEWQCGKLNGVGGKVELNESVDDAMVREWKEETGTDSPKWKLYTTVYGNGFALFVFKAKIDKHPSYQLMNDAGEELELHHAEDIVRGYQDTISNLFWLIPLAFWDDWNVYATVRENVAS